MANFRSGRRLAACAALLCAIFFNAAERRAMADDFQGRGAAESRDRTARTMEVARRAFDHFRNGLARGEWEPFLGMLTDDFTFSFPTGKYQGQHRGKDKAAEFFKYVSETFSEGIVITEVLKVTGNETTVVFEFRDEGKLRGQPYKNRVAVSLDVRGDRISAYREYFGSDGKSN